MKRLLTGWITSALLVAVGLVLPAHADAPATANASLDQATATVDKSFDYLKKQEKPDFSWQADADPPGISALVLKAFMEDELYDADMPFLDKAFDKLLSYQLQNG